MGITLYIAKRYLFTKSKQNAINIINAITAFVVIIAALALFVVMSGFAGLEKFSLSFTSVFDPDLKVVASTGKTFSYTKEQLQKLEQTNGVVAVTKVVEERVFLNFKQRNHIAYIKGIDDNYGNVNAVDSILAYGNWTITDETVVIGNGVSAILGLGIYDRTNALQIIAPKPGKGSITSTSKPYNEAFVMATGIYQLTDDLDKKYVFTSLQLAQQLIQKDAQTLTGIEVKLQPDANQADVAKHIQNIFGSDIEVKTREQLNDALYKMLNTENMAIYLIFTLVLIVALFNLAGAIAMMILDKKQNLKTLFALGITVQELRKIFFSLGTLVTLIGGSIGIILGVIAVYIQTVSPFVYMTPSLPYPVQIKVTNIFIVFITISVLGISASKIASNRISKKLIQG